MYLAIGPEEAHAVVAVSHGVVLQVLLMLVVRGVDCGAEQVYVLSKSVDLHHHPQAH